MKADITPDTTHLPRPWTYLVDRATRVGDASSLAREHVDRALAGRASRNHLETPA